MTSAGEGVSLSSREGIENLILPRLELIPALFS